MYKKILGALENTSTDETLVPQVQKLGLLVGAEILLVHVADGWAARNFNSLKLVESQEMREDREYLEATAEGMRKAGLRVSVHLAMGEPATEILKAATEGQCDLIAMTTHGHRLIGDIIYGSTIETVRHKAPVPLLVFPANKKP